MFYSVKNLFAKQFAKKGLGFCFLKTFNVKDSEESLQSKNFLMTFKNRVVVKNEVINYLEISLEHFFQIIFSFSEN